MIDYLASTLSLKGVLDGLKPFGWEHIDHWQQGEFHHDVVLRVKSPPDELPGEVIVVSTNCNGGVKEVLCLSDVPDRWGLWHHRCPDNPEFSGPPPSIKAVARTVHWFNPCDLLKPGTRSEYREEYRRRQRGGGYTCVGSSEEQPNYVLNRTVGDMLRSNQSISALGRLARRQESLMECFAHPGVQSVAVCRACSRGVCRACATDLGGAFSCSDKCRPIVERLIELQHVSLRHAGTIRSQSAFGLVLGFVFLAAGALMWSYYGFDPSVIFTGALGVVFLGQAFYSFLKARG